MGGLQVVLGPVCMEELSEGGWRDFVLSERVCMDIDEVICRTPQ